MNSYNSDIRRLGLDAANANASANNNGSYSSNNGLSKLYGASNYLLKPESGATPSPVVISNVGMGQNAEIVLPSLSRNDLPMPFPYDNNSKPILNTMQPSSEIDMANLNRVAVTGLTGSANHSDISSESNNSKYMLNPKKCTQENVAKSIALQYKDRLIEEYLPIIRNAEMNCLNLNPTIHSKNVIQNFESIKKRERQVYAFIWLMKNCVTDTNCFIPRSKIFNKYAQSCSSHSLKCLSQASLGKLIRSLFPNLKTRRLGMRGQSKYHYCGLKLISDPTVSSTSSMTTSKKTTPTKDPISLSQNLPMAGLTPQVSQIPQSNPNIVPNHQFSPMNPLLPATTNDYYKNDSSSSYVSSQSQLFESNLPRNNRYSTATATTTTTNSPQNFKNIQSTGSIGSTLPSLPALNANFDLNSNVNSNSNQINNNSITTSNIENSETLTPKLTKNDNDEYDLILKKLYTQNDASFIENLYQEIFEKSTGSFTSLELPRLPREVHLIYGTDVASSLESLYFFYCNTLFQNVAQLKFDEIKNCLDIVSPTKISPALKKLYYSEDAFDWILNCDKLTHVYMISYFSSTIVSRDSMSSSLSMIEKFANDYQDLMESSLTEQPLKIVKRKLEIAKIFSRILKKSVILYKVTKNFTDQCVTFNTISLDIDWFERIDLDKILEIIDYDCTEERKLRIKNFIREQISFFTSSLKKLTASTASSAVNSPTISPVSTTSSEKGSNDDTNTIVPTNFDRITTTSLLSNIIRSYSGFFTIFKKVPALKIMCNAIRVSDVLMGDILINSNENVLPWFLYNNLIHHLLFYLVEVNTFMAQ